MAIIDMQAMRYINLLDKVSHVKTRKCFVFNNTIYFAVDRTLVSKAIGSAAVNIKRIQDQLGKKIRIVREAEGLQDAERFIEDVVSPIHFKSLTFSEEGIVLTAGNNQSKASLIGRDKRRLEELKRIVMDVFGMELKIL